MSDKGYLSAKREEMISKILDETIDFNELFEGKKKLFGFISIGSVLEKNDRKMFRMLISMIDDHCLGKNATEEQKQLIEKTFEFIENQDIQGFADHIANILAGKIDIPYTSYEKQIFLSSLMLFNGLIGKAIEKINKLIADADAEA